MTTRRKLVFVDDETFVLQSIVNLMDWASLGYELVGTASNGQEALAIIEETCPDVVITDICMPLMDGFELSEAIYEFDPTIKIIFISGHDKFDYAQNAIRLNIQEYLLKPITPTDIQAALTRVSQNLDAQRQRALDMQEMTREYMTTIEASRRSLLISLVTEPLSLEDTSYWQNRINLYQLEIPGPHYTVISLCPRQSSSPIHAISPDMRDILFAEELSWVSYRKTVLEVCHKYLPAEAFPFAGKLIIILSHDKPDISANLDLLLQDIQQTFLKNYRRTLYLGISQASSHLMDLKRLYHQALQAYDYCQSAPNTALCYYGDFSVEMESNLDYDATPDQRLLSLIKIASYPEFEDYIVSLINQSHRQSSTPSADYLFFLELTSRVIRISQNLTGIQNSPLIESFMSQMVVANQAPVADLMQTFLAHSKKLLLLIQSERQTLKESLTQQGLRLMQQHYQDPLFTGKRLAQLMHVSPNYLSSLFTRETGQSFKEHLIQIRMNKAKELLLTSSAKVQEVALAVGYTDTHYFSYSTKRYFGLSPRQIREAAQEGSPTL